MIDLQLAARIRRLYYAEHWKIGTIATQLRVHHDSVRRVIGADSFGEGKQQRRGPRLTDPYQEKETKDSCARPTPGRIFCHPLRYPCS